MGPPRIPSPPVGSLGSGAFAIEAVRQLAKAYLGKRQEELGERIDPEQTRPFDHKAFVDTEAIVAAIAQRPGWVVEVDERRERPAGAVSTHHVHDVVLRARRGA